MSARYRLVHTTSYAYDAEVTTSYGQAHLSPHQREDQHVGSRTLVISPPAAEQVEHRDYYGNISTFFVVRDPHTRLSVTATSEVTVTRRPPDLDALEAIAMPQAAGLDPDLVEFCLASPRVPLTTDLRDYAASVFEGQQTLAGAVSELLRRISQDFRYSSGATTVLTGLSELLTRRAGVCQDFAHLAVGCLRSAGLAARYVSGYLETRPAPGAEKLQGVDASHAWASVFAPGAGWVDLDPTNNQLVDDRYVVAAVGRDYGDVPPLKGVIVTSAKHSSMRVSVDVLRVPIDA